MHLAYSNTQHQAWSSPTAVCLSQQLCRTAMPHTKTADTVYQKHVMLKLSIGVYLCYIMLITGWWTNRHNDTAVCRLVVKVNAFMTYFFSLFLPIYSVYRLACSRFTGHDPDKRKQPRHGWRCKPVKPNQSSFQEKRHYQTIQSTVHLNLHLINMFITSKRYVNFLAILHNKWHQWYLTRLTAKQYANNRRRARSLHPSRTDSSTVHLNWRLPKMK